jgi:chemotaxis family two-component system response regulator Rcp1
MEAKVGVPIEILLVEDNPVDVMLTQETMKHVKLANNLHVTVDGEDAMAFLKREGKYANAVRPDIILLDLNLPKKDGREVLQEVKSHPTLKAIPVVVLTTSDSDEDILKSYQLYANCYITKPVNINQFTKIVKTIEDFWFTIVKLPPR